MTKEIKPNGRIGEARYSTREVARLLGLSPEQTRFYVRAGLVEPRRGMRRGYRFSFRDIVLLRTAKGLVEAGIPIRRIRLTLEKLQQQLPQDYPLTAVQIWADGNEVYVKDGCDIWKPESGQTLFNFEVSQLETEVKSLGRTLQTR